MKASWSATRIRAVSTASVLRVTASAKSIALSVQAGVMAATSVVGHFIKLLRLQDNANASETTAFRIGKTLSDSSGTSDDLQIGISKGLDDMPWVSDLSVKTAHKYLNNAAYAEPGYFLENYATAGEDVPTVSDRITLTANKGIFETPRFSDAAYRSLTKTVTETVRVTDDLDGQATVDDDEHMAFTKVMTEVTGVSDQFSRVVTYQRTNTEGLGVSELAIKGCGKPLADFAFMADTSVLKTAKSFAEAVAATETYSQQTTKVSTETARVTESGSLRSQGYVSFNYLSEDYVGDSRTF